MKQNIIPESELILNPDGSIYHLKLHPEQIADDIITVGDPNRVPEISKYFDSIEYQVENREFITHTGSIGDKQITVIATGIGTDNIDIVFNELDALANVDLKTREILPDHTSLNFIRLGTAGGLQGDIPVDSLVATDYSIGLDGLLHFYQFENSAKERELLEAFEWFYAPGPLPKPYISSCNQDLYDKLSKDMIKGITATCTGFYGPQGRVLRAQLYRESFIQNLSDFRYENKRITNFEMETSGIYGLSRVLGHNALSISAILANRVTNEFSKQPKKIVDTMIEQVLEKLCSE